MVAPGKVEPATSSTLVMVMSGVASTGVTSSSELFSGVGSSPLVPSSAIETALLISVTPAANGLSSTTAKVKVPAGSLASTFPRDRVQVVPAAAPSTQLQPAELPVVVKVVLAGTVSVTTTPVAF